MVWRFFQAEKTQKEWKEYFHFSFLRIVQNQIIEKSFVKR